MYILVFILNETTTNLVRSFDSDPLVTDGSIILNDFKFITYVESIIIQVFPKYTLMGLTPLY